MLLWVLDIIKDLAVLAAAVVAALIAQQWYRSTVARAQSAAEALRLGGEQMRQAHEAASRLESIAGLMARDIAAIAARNAEDEVRASIKVRVHAMLQATHDPFLTFAEIERALAEGAPSTGARQAIGPALSGDGLRRAVMEMVRDHVIAQIDGDRYFIASDFETEDQAQTAG